MQEEEDRVLIRQLAALCSILIREWWLGYSKVAQTRPQHEGHYITEVGSNGRGESQILHLYSVTLLVTDRKKSRHIHVSLTLSFLRVKMWLPGVRSVFDQSIC